MPDRSVHGVVTSPPYGVYGNTACRTGRAEVPTATMPFPSALRFHAIRMGQTPGRKRTTMSPGLTAPAGYRQSAGTTAASGWSLRWESGCQPGPRYARSPARTARRRDRLVEPRRRISCFQEGREFGQDLSTGHGRITEAGINDTGVDRLPPKNAMLQLARLSVALQQPWLWCMGAATRRYDELSEPCNVDQCVSIANCWSAQPALRKPLCAGTGGAGPVAEIVNRGWATAGYEIRRKTSSGGQRFLPDSVALQRRFSFWRLAFGGFAQKWQLFSNCV